MIKKFLLMLPFFCISCTFTPKNNESWLEFQKNACLPTSIIYKKDLEKKEIWSKIIVYHYKDSTLGHAIAVYMYPPGQNKMWTYDFWGSYRARAYKDQPLQIAKEAEKKRHRDPNNVLRAQFID